MRIFVCGGSAVGKTSFVEYISEKYNIPKDEEVIRGFSYDWFKKYSVLHRETLFLLSQIKKEEAEGDRIFDRSILDVIAWMVDYRKEHDTLLYQYIAKTFIDKQAYYILTPQETENFVKEHILDYKLDPIRWTCLTSKLVLVPECSDEVFVERYVAFMKFEREVMRQILKMTGARFISISNAFLDKYEWQKEAEKWLIEMGLEKRGGDKRRLGMGRSKRLRRICKY